jgi:hypothetical protein
MSRPNDKLDLDALLASWPAPARDEKAWEERADAIVKAALAASDQAGADAAVAKTLFEAPPLAAEPGEPPAVLASAGEKIMSQDSEQGGAPKQDVSPPSAVPSTVAPRSAERRKGSLKDIAARASQAGVASKPGSAMPVAPQSRAGATSATSTPLPKAAESGALEDSGIVDLNVVKAKATPEQKAAADKAAPATQGIFEEEKPAAAAAGGKVVALPTKTAAKAEEKKKGSGGVIAGVAIAVLGVAAAFAITKVNKPAEPTATTETRPTPAQESPQAPAQPAEQAQAAAPDTPPPLAATEGQPTEAAPSGGGEKVAAAPAGGSQGSVTQQPTGGSEPAQDPSKQAEAAPKEGATPPAPGTPAAPGDLKGAMAAAVGADANKGTAPTAENAEPAAGSRNQSIPEQPSQGQVNAAIRGVMPSVKACVAGADDVSRATVTFGSNGTVKSVSVTGWAASHGATGCIKAALQGANVGPFAKSTFTTGFPIRP